MWYEEHPTRRFSGHEGVEGLDGWAGGHLIGSPSLAQQPLAGDASPLTVGSPRRGDDRAIPASEGQVDGDAARGGGGMVRCTVRAVRRSIPPLVPALLDLGGHRGLLSDACV